MARYQFLLTYVLEVVVVRQHLFFNPFGGDHTTGMYSLYSLLSRKLALPVVSHSIAILIIIVNHVTVMCVLFLVGFSTAIAGSPRPNLSVLTCLETPTNQSIVSILDCIKNCYELLSNNTHLLIQWMFFFT